MRFLVQWDNPTQIVWNAVAIALVIAVVAAAWRTPRATFAAARADRWWVIVTCVAPALYFNGYVLPFGVVLWVAYWRPRLRRIHPLAPQS